MDFWSAADGISPSVNALTTKSGLDAYKKDDQHDILSLSITILYLWSQSKISLKVNW